MNKEETIAQYAVKLQSLRQFGLTWPPKPSPPTKIFDFLYIGNMDDAKDKELMKRLNISHVINCVSRSCITGSEYYADSSVVKYYEFASEDCTSYDIMQHFDTVYGIIEDARTSGGVAFIHCEMGVNRSGALTIAYIMVHNKWDPIRAATYFRDKRTRVMSNSNFQKQLIAFAIDRNLINSSSTECALMSEEVSEPRTAQDYAIKFRLSMSRAVSFLPKPLPLTQILDFLYLGNIHDARNTELIRRRGITHVINCISGLCATGCSYYGNTIQRYCEFKSQDMPSYNILQHFQSVYEIIEDARTTGGKAFIHCELGVNRSGALTVAYVMVHKGWDPITAAVYVKQKRTLLLSNVSFQHQLIEFAVLKKLLQFGERNGVVDDES